MSCFLIEEISSYNLVEEKILFNIKKNNKNESCKKNNFI